MRKPKPNPLLETVVLAKERANLVAGLLSVREPDTFKGLTTKRERPKAIVHHDQGGAFLSHAWVGHLLLEEGRRLSYSLRGPKKNPNVEPFFSRFKAEHQELLMKQSASKPSMRFWPNGSGPITSTGCIQACGTKRPKRRLKKP
ncbi:hypothetical protein [Hydrogenibacillus sp. N12]|uniref:hypothetical protein n=1 Tax=Hydrogenibacillus sp. N12 TaxID=2866627 RepID=UPI001C7DD2AE|nr:hypothetical protein [Hydrogenibacillus sp. N12]QZA33213.1 hypothetical protein K2M58_01200 [Hydrogenibacillus sp. N12]